MNSKQVFQVALGLVVGAMLIGVAMFQSPNKPEEVSSSNTAASILSIDQEAALSGDFIGQIELNWVLTGAYSNTLATPTPAPGGSAAPGKVGDLELALRLEQTGQQVTGFVILEGSIAFPETHKRTIDGKEVAVGPRVFGTNDGTTLTLESERFSIQLSPEQRLEDGQRIPERRVTRQFSLKGPSPANESPKLQGEYRETLWGYDIKPSTAIGAFAANKVAVPFSTPKSLPDPSTPVVPGTPGTPGATPTTPDRPTGGGTLYLPSLENPE